MKSNGAVLKAIILLFVVVSSGILVSGLQGNEVIAKAYNVNESEVSDFVNQIVTQQLEDHNIAGASVAIVKDGQLIFAEGFGYSDASLNLEADSNTMFRIGSITKLFTWTALMQLVEKGDVSLEEDITKYLGDIKLGGNYEQPITIKNLMTHTAGIEDKLTNLFMNVKEEVPPLHRALLEDKRNRIFEPGEIVAYSNYGAALAGLIIENVSGIPYEDYIEKNILLPLGMNRSTLKQPASSEYINVSKGHIYSKGVHSVCEDPLTQLPPIGAMSTTAEDLAKFMMMHLNKGQYQGVQILQEETAELMHKTHYVSDERLPGICLGFIEWKRNNKRIIWHSGGTALFNSLCMLIPEENTGVFISYNGPNSGNARSEFRQKFLDGFYPYTPKKIVPTDDFNSRANMYKGYYKEGRMAIHNADKLIYAFSRYKKVTVNNDGTLNFRGTKYVEVKPLEFSEVGGQGKLIFEEDAQGHIKYAYQDFEPHEAYIKARWYENPQLAMSLLLWCIFIFVSVLVIDGIQRVRYLKGYLKSNHCKSHNWFIVICLLHLLFPLGAAIGIGVGILTDISALMTGVIPMVLSVSLLPSLAAGIITACLIGYVFIGGRHKVWTLDKKLFYFGIVLHSILFIGWICYWNLLGIF